MSVRISANDWVGDEGVTPDEAVEIARAFSDAGADIIDVSAGQTSIDADPRYGRMFQTPFSDRIRNEAGDRHHGRRQHLRSRPRQLDPDGGAAPIWSRSPARIWPIPTGRCTPQPASATASPTGRCPMKAGRDQEWRLAGRAAEMEGEA